LQAAINTDFAGVTNDGVSGMRLYLYRVPASTP
jgi:hypothetical protein